MQLSASCPRVTVTGAKIAKLTPRYQLLHQPLQLVRRHVPRDDFVIADACLAQGLRFDRVAASGGALFQMVAVALNSTEKLGNIHASGLNV